MNYWLVKSEPSTYSWDDLVKEGSTVWTGVRNFLARNNLKAMKKGDLVFFYHSNTDKAIVGIAQVTKEFYPDPTSDDPAWVVVDLVPVKPLQRPVDLAAIKADKAFTTMMLVTHSRLSVSPVTEAEFKHILKLALTEL